MENNTSITNHDESVTKSDTDQIPSPTAQKPAVKKKGKVYKPLQKPTNRHVAVKTLLEHSELSQSEIGKALNYSTTYVKELKHKLDKTSLVTVKRLKRAYKVVDNILEQKPLQIEKVVNGIVTTINDYPSHTVALDAAKRVIDQHQPIIQRHQQESISINLDGTLLDYSNFRRKD